MRIVRFECGCIGTEPNDKHESAILQACDAATGGPGMRNRDMEGSTFVAASAEWAERLWWMAIKAEQYDDLRHVLRTALREDM